ncbi:MAG: hypothetical protein LH606_11195 [Cytophagaceae bacterium]|nr:hypothetical protein [Cytophagaceae bacterium]
MGKSLEPVENWQEERHKLRFAKLAPDDAICLSQCTVKLNTEIISFIKASMIYQYNELNAQFGYLLEHAPVKKAEVLPTLFDIAGFPHYERVVSNVSAFFFQTENPHGLGPLFLNALT